MGELLQRDEIIPGDENRDSLLWRAKQRKKPTEAVRIREMNDNLLVMFRKGGCPAPKNTTPLEWSQPE